MSPDRRRRRLGRLAAVAAVYLALLAWSAVVIAGQPGRRHLAVVCSSIDELCRGWAAAFTADTGIEVDLVRLSTGEALARISRTGGGAFDVWHGGTADAFETAKARGLLLAYRPQAADAVPGRYADAGGSWTGVYVGVLGFCSNTAVLARLGVGVPHSWDDLLDSRLASQISMPNPATSGTGYTVLLTQRERLGSDEAALGYLRALDRNVLQYTNSGLAPAGIAARGEAAVGLTFSQHCRQAQGSGHPELAITYPAEGTGFEVGAVAILAGTADADAARRYADFAVSAQAQRLETRAGTGQLPTRAGLDADPALGLDARLLPYGIDEAAAARARLTALFAREVHS